jgi:hypothetical protein
LQQLDGFSAFHGKQIKQKERRGRITYLKDIREQLAGGAKEAYIYRMPVRNSGGIRDVQESAPQEKMNANEELTAADRHWDAR